AKAASQILFGKSTEENVRELSAEAFQLIGQEVTLHEINKDLIPNGINIVDLLSENATIFSSKGEARRALKNNAVAVNKNKVQDSKMITSDDVIKENYILLQNGKKNYHLIVLQD
ncbi:MAG: tyrosyl-tRNA synthetase, partial [Flavobacteriales bacterium]